MLNSSCTGSNFTIVPITDESEPEDDVITSVSELEVCEDESHSTSKQIQMSKQIWRMRRYV
jgi:hypothetical protein